MDKVLNLKSDINGYRISTIKVKFMDWYGPYETGIALSGLNNWRIVKAYNTEEEAIKGHNEIIKMTGEQLNNLKQIKEKEVDI